MSKPFATVVEPRTSLTNKTGSWRTVRPEYVHRLPPCNVTCPAGENIQQWLSLAQEGKFFEAWQEMVKNNPFPATMGRVCYHTCEKVCNRGQYDGSVNINLIERSIGDMAIAKGWSFEKSNAHSDKKVLIVGSGPSGLTAAYFLKKFGYNVDLFESHKYLGGMMRYGVPKYRLPRHVLDAEIKRIQDCGVNIICNKKVENLKDELVNYDAVYLAIGASVASSVNIDVESKATVMSAIDLFQKMEDDSNDLPNLGKSVVVYGGGNTAIDAARTALRLGAEDVKIVYRRTINNMPAHETEIQDALSEGIEILCLRTISSINGKKVILDKMDYDEENGILSRSGKNEMIVADSVIFAIGQAVECSFLQGIEGISVSEKGLIDVDNCMMTGLKGVFAGGDAILGKRTVTHAIGYGKKAAKCIDAFLQGRDYVPNSKNEVANFKKLNTEYYKKDERKEVSRLGNLDFEEKDVSYSNNEIIQEAMRCFSCGNCFHCDNCYSYCPDNAIIKHEDGTLEINYDYCKGCGICASECPCGAIKMTV
ncbi:MAG: NAD(P)-binding protein [Alphaproteobacteria bacterium]|nr:NAD(P)-binding protein [Alphaproteobacteria bacterium]